ncbi:MAG: TIGR02453 family protein [Proteobacteria bacterium]|nr:TIGR02453 family protein [Pseudomonadota bacterium]
MTPRTFQFLKALAAHNDRAWFNANKARYHEVVRDPLLCFIADVGPKLLKISKQVVADPRPVGGSLFRVYRDTRFSRDKRPYKTYAGMTFRHVDGKDVQAPGLYLHVEPGRIFMAAGIWHGASETLGQIRDAIVAQPAHWQRVRASRAFRLDESQNGLKRAPRGYDPEHVHVEDLKRKSFTSSVTFTQQQACASDFPSRFARVCRQRSPLMAFLADAVGLPW